MAFTSSPVIGKAIKTENLLHPASSSGSERKIFDAVKSLLSLLKEWDDQHLAGKLALASISKLKDSLGWKLDCLPPGPKMNALQEACNNLSTVVDEMVSVAQNLQTLAQQIAVLSSLEQFQAPKSAKYPVFPSGTWDCRKFGDVFHSISNAFHEEVKICNTIKEAAVMSPDKSTLTTYIARWNNPGPFNNTVVMLINGLLIESSICAI